jgi:hypothetical protein
MGLMTLLGDLAAIWRYPVKSLAAEALEQTRIETEGLPGDRAAALFVEAGHARAGKPYRGKEHNLLHTTANVSEAIAMASERSVTIAVRDQDEHYFDAAPVSLIFDRWIAEVERALDEPLDPLRWRPNLYAKAAPDFAYGENDLLGQTIELGEVRLRVRDTIKRCVTTTYDVKTGEPYNDVLLYVAQRRANVMGVYCEVELAGMVRVGEALRLRAR